MAKYIIDVNLPYYFSLWNSDDYLHVLDINEKWEDEEIWAYAKKNNLTIITKDADFSNMILLNGPPPRVIHIKFGNMKMNEFHQAISDVWEDVCSLSEQYCLIRVFTDRVECIK